MQIAELWMWKSNNPYRWPQSRDTNLVQCVDINVELIGPIPISFFACVTIEFSVFAIDHDELLTELLVIPISSKYWDFLI